MESHSHVISLNYPQKTTVFILNYNFPSLIKSLIIYWTTVQQFELQFKWLSFSKHKEGQFSHWRQGNPYIQNEGVHLEEARPLEKKPHQIKKTKKIPPTALGWHHHDLPLRLSWEWLGWELQETEGARGESSETSLMPETSVMLPSDKPFRTACRLVTSTFGRHWRLVNSTSQQDGQPSVTGRRASPSSSQKDDPTKRFQATSVFRTCIK